MLLVSSRRLCGGTCLHWTSGATLLESHQTVYSTLLNLSLKKDVSDSASHGFFFPIPFQDFPRWAVAKASGFELQREDPETWRVADGCS